MARQQKNTPQVDEVRAYVAGVAKNLIDKLYGPPGPSWGTSLTELEDLLLQVRQVLTQEMLDLALARQAQALPQQPEATRLCPGCQQPLACDGVNPRVVQTRAGTAQWIEPEGFCTRCRRAFFPSVQGAGHRPG